MKKNIFENPSLEIIFIFKDDIISTSGETYFFGDDVGTNDKEKWNW